MKKILSFLLVFIFLVNYLSPVNASSYPEEVTGILSNEDVQIDILAAEYYQWLGSQELASNVLNAELCIMSTTDCVNVVEQRSITGMTKYYQNQQSWSSHIMQSCGLSIGGYGCALTSLAMVASKYTLNRNPGVLNTFLGVDACNMNWGPATQKLGLNFESIFSTSNPSGNTSYAVPLSTVKTQLLGVMRSGRPAIVALEYKNSSNVWVNHFVVVRSYEEWSNGTYIFGIHDPSAHLNLTTLDQYMSRGYKIRSIRSFYK